jgi:hypothetical protein
MTGDAWLVIMWNGKRWVKHSPMNSNFREHLEDFNALVDTAHMHEPPIDARIYKSIHECWLDDISNWDNPLIEGEITLDQVMQELESDRTKPDFAEQITGLCFKDRLHVSHFAKYLRVRQKYGDEVLLKRKFWRRYLGVDDGKED